MNLASATSAATSAVLVCVAPPASAAQAQWLRTYLIFGEVPKPALRRTGLSWVDAQIERLSVLPANWDGYGAEPVRVDRLNTLATLLERHLPSNLEGGSIVPGADGSVQAEWHLRRSSFGLLIDDDGTQSVWVKRGNEPEVERYGIEAPELLKWAALDAMA